MSKSPSPSISAIATPELLNEATLIMLSEKFPFPSFNHILGPDLPATRYCIQIAVAIQVT